jgi:hypothetical protein
MMYGFLMLPGCGSVDGMMNSDESSALMFHMDGRRVLCNDEFFP